MEWIIHYVHHLMHSYFFLKYYKTPMALHYVTTTKYNKMILELQGAVHAVDSMVCKTPDEK